VSCYVERRQPPDVFSDGLNCILNFCDCSVAVVGGERLPSSSINSVLASPASSHLLLPLVAYSLHFPSTPPWARARKVGVPHTIPAISGNVSRLLLRGLRRLGVLEGGFLLRVRGLAGPCLPPGVV
jgi:hypothetical protein